MGLREALGIAKADESLTDLVDAVRQAWYAATESVSPMPMSSGSWLDEVYTDHVIACVEGDHYSIPYNRDDNGDVTFDTAGAVEVERTWQPVAKTVTIEKIDEDRHVAFGWAYVAERDGTQVIDHSGEFVEKADLEDAAYLFNIEARSADEAHTDPVVGTLVESFVSTPEKLEKMGLAPDALPTGWWTGWYVPDDDVFAKIKDGTYAMLSIGGTARKERADA